MNTRIMKILVENNGFKKYNYGNISKNSMNMKVNDRIIRTYPCFYVPLEQSN